MKDMTVELVDAMERLIEAVETLTSTQVSVAAAADERVGAIVATVESEREVELVRRLEAAEAKIAELTAAAAPVARKTAVTVAKQVTAAGDAGAVDAALASLSIEQRFAVKAEMLRAGLIG